MTCPYELAGEPSAGAGRRVTLINAVVGFVAGVVAFTDPRLAARLVLLAAIVDAPRRDNRPQRRQL